MTEGFSRASRSRIARACSDNATASAGRPARSLEDADVVVTRGQVALELGDRRVFARQPLADRAGLLVRRQRLRWPDPNGPGGGRCCCGSWPGRSGARAARGCSRASRSRIARACSYEASASASRPLHLSCRRCCCDLRQVALELGDRWVLARQPLDDREDLLVRRQRLRRPARSRWATPMWS